MYHLFLIFTLILWNQWLFAAEIYETYYNHRYDYSIDYPKDVLFPQGESDNGDGQKFLSKMLMPAYWFTLPIMRWSSRWKKFTANSHAEARLKNRKKW